MTSTRVKTTLLAASLLLLVPVAADAATTKQKVRGKLAATADDGDAKGKFWIGAKARNDEFREALLVLAKGLDATEDDEGNRPEYNVWLVNADGAVEADFGVGRLNSRGKFRFQRFNTVLQRRDNRRDLFFIEARRNELGAISVPGTDVEDDDAFRNMRVIGIGEAGHQVGIVFYDFRPAPDLIIH